MLEVTLNTKSQNMTVVANDPAIKEFYEQTIDENNARLDAGVDPIAEIKLIQAILLRDAPADAV